MPALAPRRAMDVDALDVDLRVPDVREVRRRRDGTRRNATRQLETNLNSKLKRTTDDAMRRRRQGLTRRAKELRELRATLARELARRRREAFGEDDETAAPSGAKEEEENDDDDDVRGDDARGEECVFEDDDATVPNARSLSDGEEYAAAVAAALEPTIPQSDDFAAGGDDGGDDGVDAHDGGGRSIPTVLDGHDEALATLAALGLGRGDAAKMRWIGVGTFAVSVAQAGLGWWLVSTTTPRGWDEPLAPRATSARRLGAAETFGFLANGASMVARSILLQSSFFVAVVVAARNLEPSGLAAHHIVVSLWMVCSYVVDGFATCATVIGSRLFGAGRKDELVRLSHTLVAWGVVTGFVFSAALVAGESAIPSVFTRDAKTKEALLGSGVWRVLVLAQPINAAVFVYDGFIYATHSFSFVREVMATGVGLVFLPTLYLANRPLVSLKGIWTAKLALNAWRVAWLAGRVHVWLPRQEMSPRDDNGENESESDSDDDEEAAHYEPLLPGNESEEDVESVTPQTNDVQYESSLKPSKIKAKGLSPIRTPELAMARASSLRASAGEFAPSSSVL